MAPFKFALRASTVLMMNLSHFCFFVTSRFSSVCEGSIFDFSSVFCTCCFVLMAHLSF